MADPREYLNRVWAVFRKLGITDDLTIIEYVAALILQSEAPKLPGADHWPRDPKLQLRLPSLAPFDEEEIKQSLSKAVEVTGDAATLFDQFVICRLPEMITGGRYPTPRHIARTMARLARVKQGDSLADLACGSGGLLVAAANVRPRVTGVEISPNWARLAWTNTVLHRLSGPGIPMGQTEPRVVSLGLFGIFEEPDIFVGNAFSVVSGSLEKPEFDCILMNPPFGETVDAHLVNQLQMQVKSGRSETLFTALALKKLKQGGHLTILLPSSPLSSNSTGEHALRTILLEEHQLETVVSLPRDAFQPYSSLQTYLLIIRKPQRNEAANSRYVWFYRVQHDGFTGGRNRQPDPAHDELPRLEGAVLVQTKPLAQAFEATEQFGVGVLPLHQTDGSLCGYQFSQFGETNLSFTLARLKSNGAQHVGLLATIRDSKPAGYLYVSGEELLSGPAESQLCRFDFRRYSDEPLDCIFVDDELADFSLTMTRDSGQIKKKQTRQATIEWRTQIDLLGTLALIVDPEGAPLFYPLTIDSLEWLKRERPCAVALQTKDEQPVGHLLIFDNPTLEVVSLSNATGEQQLLLDLLPGGRLLITLPEQAMPTHFQVVTETQTFVSDTRRVGVVVDLNGAWFGIAVPTEQILKTETRDLRPSKYFPSEVAPQPLRAPAQLLADIKKGHQELDRQINFLLGLVEMKPLTETRLPFPIAEDLAPFCELSSVQREVWSRIQALTDLETSSDGEQYQTPRSFRIDDVSQGLPIADVQCALELFECMGLIVPVSIDSAPYYRHVAGQDIVTKKANP